MSVDWEATAITAQSSDFIPRSGTVQLAEGVSSARLPLSVINDADPEFAETLRVNLVGSGGDARLGGVLVATVTILANDDPNGALGEQLCQFYLQSLSCDTIAPGPSTGCFPAYMRMQGKLL